MRLFSHGSHIKQIVPSHESTVPIIPLLAPSGTPPPALHRDQANVSSAGTNSKAASARDAPAIMLVM